MIFWKKSSTVEKRITQEELDASAETINTLLDQWMTNELLLDKKNDSTVEKDNRSSSIVTMLGSTVGNLMACSIVQLMYDADAYTLLLNPDNMERSNAASRYHSMLIGIEQSIPPYILKHYRESMVNAAVRYGMMEEEDIRIAVYESYPGIWLVPFIQQAGTRLIIAVGKSHKNQQ